MSSYEDEQARLVKLWNEALSDESDFSSTVSEYEPSSESESDTLEECVSPKKRQRADQKINMPSTSSYHLDKEQAEPMLVEQATLEVEGDFVADNPQPIDSTNSDNVDRIIEQVIMQYTVFMESDDDSSQNDEIIHTINWGPVTGNNLKVFPLSANNLGIRTVVYDNYQKSPYDFYKLLITDDIFQLFVTETNRYAAQEKSKAGRGSRIKQWKDTTQDEMEKFVACLMWMGLVSLPSVSSYWSKNFIYKNELCHIMARNRFQLLLKNWHFSNNEFVLEDNDRLHKIDPLLSKLKNSFQMPIVAGEFVCIDETLVPFKGRLKFKQYISNKRHKFGIKVFKLCLEGGYLYDLKVYCGQEKNATEYQTVPTKVVTDLTKNLLGKGRTICVDNYYTSVELAHELLKNKTYLLGTLRANRKNNPKNVINKKLKIGEVSAEESNTGIFVEKWKDKRDVIMLTTKYVPEMVTVHKRTGDIMKPKSIIEYNKHKSYIDISDQMKAYNSSLRRGVKWYRKLAIELVVGAAIVNSYWLHQHITNDKMSITKFREEIIKGLIKRDESDSQPVPDVVHKLVTTDKKKLCAHCYQKKTVEFGRNIAKNKTGKTKHRCEGCAKHLCLDCFFEIHNTELAK